MTPQTAQLLADLEADAVSPASAQSRVDDECGGLLFILCLLALDS